VQPVQQPVLGVEWQVPVPERAIPPEAAVNGFGADPHGGTDGALRRALAAESALQAEVGPLRDRLAQMERTLQAEREQVTKAVSEMLTPLHTCLTSCGVKVEQVAQLVPAAVELVQALRSEVQRLRQGVREPGGGAPISMPPTQALVQLTDAIAALHLQVQDMARWQAQHQKQLAEQMQAVPKEVFPSSPAAGTTWIVTDEMAKTVEDAIRRSQQATGNPYAG
jgi:hypothetical protein